MIMLNFSTRNCWISQERCYELISQGLGGVIAEENQVIEKGSVLVCGQDVQYIGLYSLWYS